MSQEQPPIANGHDDEAPPPRASRLRENGHARITLNLTSMIDVVFLLLVYFMVATEFKANEEIYRLDLPDRASALAASDPFELDDEPLRITVTSTGQRRDGYRIQVDGPYQQPLTFEELFTFLQQRQINTESLTGLFEPDHPIVIVPTNRTRWEHAVSAFNAAARARYVNISFGKPT